MFCSKCSRDLKNCVCPDIDERMRGLTDKGGPLAAKWCMICDKHYARCRCDEPLYGIRVDGLVKATTMPLGSEP